MTEQEKSKIVADAIASYSGQAIDLERALGMLMMGDAYGWRVLVLVHERRTLRKYEDILGIKVREVFPERGPMSHKSWGLKITDALGNFWKVVKGEASRKGITELSDEEPKIGG